MSSKPYTPIHSLLPRLPPHLLFLGWHNNGKWKNDENGVDRSTEHKPKNKFGEGLGMRLIRIQWSPSITDTFGNQHFVRHSKVSPTQALTVDFL